VLMAAGNGLGRALTRLNRADAEYLARVPQSLRGWLSPGEISRVSIVGAYAMSAARLLETCGAGGIKTRWKFLTGARWDSWQ
jgi:hypothetical protein